MSTFTLVMTAVFGDHPMVGIALCIIGSGPSWYLLIKLFVKLHVSKDSARSKNFAAMTAAEKRRK
jgi:hypothetical protein